MEAGASPADARKWWLGELSRRANEAGVELAALARTSGVGDDAIAGAVARVSELVASGALNDTLARQVLDGVLAGEGSPDEVVAADVSQDWPRTRTGSRFSSCTACTASSSSCTCCAWRGTGCW